MAITKLFPSDYEEKEIIALLSELIQQLNNEILPEGEKQSIERNIMVCQNQLVFLSLIESNSKLTKQQEILTKQQESLVKQQEILTNLFIENSTTSKRTAKEAKFFIIAAILTFLATSFLEIYHMHEENVNQKNILKEIQIDIVKFKPHAYF